MKRLRRQATLAALALLAAIVAAPVAATLAAEPHFPDDIVTAPDGYDPEGSCYACHTLDAGEATPGTTFVQKSARTMPTILQKGPAPEKLGCTFCHFSLTSNREMREVFTHFGPRLSKHPVGRKISNGTETDGEYFSTIDSDTADELDCIDCHDPALLAPDLPATYVGHIDTSLRGNNPFMLRGGPFAAAGAYDDLCRLCHGAGQVYALGPHDDGAIGRPIVEDDGTRLPTTPATAPETDKAQCTKCHDTHYSDKVRLFNDGHERDTPVDGADCTALCHYAGDPDSSYDTHGHNKGTSTYKYRLGEVDVAAGSVVALTMPCTACHASLDTDNPATRADHVRGAVGADIRERYLSRFNLDKQSIDPRDEGSLYGNPLRGTCTSACHQRCEEHTVATAGTPLVGCLDCHDEHAEGSGAGSNAFMIPLVSKKNGVYNPGIAGYRVKPGREAVAYDVSRTRYDASGAVNAEIDFYNEANTGVCDNSECHGKWGASLDDLMTSGGDFTHTGPPVDKGATPSVDCAACHRHNGDKLGGWRAWSSCDECHLASGRGHGGATKSRSTHDRHVGSPYVAGCAACHAHNGSTEQPGSGDHGVGGMVNFGGAGALMTDSFDYAEGFDTDAGCSTADNGCHDNAGGAGRWTSGTLASCADCHAAAGKLLARRPASGLHAVKAVTRHDGDLLDGGCVNCHAAAPTRTHLDGKLDTATSAAFTFAPNVLSYSAAAGCRAAVSCHGSTDGGRWRRRWLGAVDAVPGTAGNDTPGRAVCQNCHGDVAGWRWDDADPAAAIHRGLGTGDTAGGPTSQGARCRACHGWGEASYDTTWRTGSHGNGSIEVSGLPGEPAPDAGPR